MAFATRSLRILYKVYNGSKIATYSTLQQPLERITLIRAAPKCCYNNAGLIKPKITISVPKFYSTKAKATILHNVSEQNKQRLENEETKRDEEEKQKQWRRMKFSFVFFGASMGITGSFLFFELARPNYDENGKVIEDEFSHLPFFKQWGSRLFKELNFYKNLVQEPSREKLLPDPLEYPYIQPPYTIVLELKDVLVHPDWTYQTGWRFKKRPGVDSFIEAVAPPQFELVIYTAEHGMTVTPIVDALDPRGYIMYRLVRDATRYVNGHHVKDLDSLNRDLSKVIVVDWDDESVKFHPENMLKLPRWSGNDDDLTLLDLAAFLRTIHAENVEDVREVLSYYKQFDNPMEAFRENQRKLLVQIEEQKSKAQQQPTSKVAVTTWRPSFLQSR